MEIQHLEQYAAKLSKIDRAYWEFNDNGSLSAIKELLDDDAYSDLLLNRFHVADRTELLQSLLLQKEFPEYKERLSPVKPLFVYCTKYMPGNEVFGAEILYIMRGKFQCEVDGKAYWLKEGCTYLFPPCRHRYKSADNEGVGVGIVMTPTFLSSTLFSTVPQNNIVSAYFSRCLYTDYNSGNLTEFDTQDNDTLRYYILTLVHEFTEQSIFSEKIIATLPVLIIFEMLKTQVDQHNQAEQESLNGHQILDVIKYIQDNYRSITLQDAANHFHFNASYLSKLIKKHTGQTFMEIIHSAKMDQARTLLVHSTRSVTDVAHEVGYSNVNHFYHLFNKEYKCTPSEYRERFSAPISSEF